MAGNSLKLLYNLGSLERVPPGEGRAFNISGLEITIFHDRDGKLYAAESRCPHQGGPLADGLLGGGKIICPLHAYAFDLLTGEQIGGRCRSLQRYEIWVNPQGEMILDAGSGEERHF